MGRVRKELAKQLDAIPHTARKRSEFHAVLGDASGTLLAYDANGLVIPGYVMARIQFTPEDSLTTRKVRCSNGTKQFGSPVIVSYGRDGELEVVDVDHPLSLEFSRGRGLNTSDHAWTHDMGGPDPVFLNGLFFKPFMVKPNNPPDLTVLVQQTHYMFAGINELTPTDEIDLSSFVPTDSSEQCIAIISLDPSTNTFDVTTSTPLVPIIGGGESMPFSQEDVADVVVAAGLWRLVAVRLYAGQTQIKWTDFITSLHQYADASSVSTLPDFSVTGPGVLVQTSMGAAVTVENPLDETRGGTGQTTITTGDLLYGSASNVISKRGIGSASQFLFVSGGLPVWHTLVAGDIPTLAHSSLSGLTSGDDHTQYLLLAGRAGGQIAIGGTASGEDLTLNSTAHATKGSVFIGGGYIEIDEAQGLAAIGGAVVALNKLTIYTGGVSNRAIVLRPDPAQSGAIFRWEDSAANAIGTINQFGSLSLIGASLDTSRFVIGGTLTNSNTSTLSLANINGSILPTGATLTNPIGLIVTPTLSTSTTTISNYQGLFLRLDTGAGFTGTLNNAFTIRIVAPTWAGTLPTSFHHIEVGALSLASTVNAGININAITGATTNYSLRSRAGLFVINEDGDPDSDFRVEGDTIANLLFVDASADNVGIGDNAPVTKLHVLLTDAGTNAIVNTLTLAHRGGTPAAGFGTGISVLLESSTTNDQNAGRLTYEWVVATHASRTARSKWTVYDTAEREGIRIEANGSAVMLGFFGQTAVVKTAAYSPTNVTTDRAFDANSTTIDEIADVLGTLILDLKALGLPGY